MAQVHFRISDEGLAFIDRAAAIRGVTRTEFVLRSSEAAAIETLNERPIIALDDEAWDAFAAALGAPVEPDGAVKDFNHRMRMAELVRHAGNCANLISPEELQASRRKG